MSVPRRLQPLRHVLLVFLCIMLVFGGALAWLGWRLLERDGSLERKQVQERLDLVADHMANELQRSLLELESYLSFTPSPTAKALPEGVVVLLAAGQSVDVYPPSGLLFYPAIVAGAEPPAVRTAGREGDE